jgi:hypothetical protein
MPPRSMRATNSSVNFFKGDKTHSYCFTGNMPKEKTEKTDRKKDMSDLERFIESIPHPRNRAEHYQCKRKLENDSRKLRNQYVFIKNIKLLTSRLLSFNKSFNSNNPPSRTGAMRWGTMCTMVKAYMTKATNRCQIFNFA